MLVFPNAKINLGLRIVNKRSDGYHDLQTIFYPIPIHDILELISTRDNEVVTTNSGLKVNEQTNLCVKAYNLLKHRFATLPGVRMHLHKTIPIGAGLGGGSSDGAFTLKLLNKQFNLGLSTEQLIDMALQLGSDCPFFIINKPCYAEGRGELLQTLKLDLANYKFFLVNPSIHINTGWVFSQVKSIKDHVRPLKEIAGDISSWKNELVNDLEEPVFAHYPEIKKIKDELYDAGAIYASMSGSGSTVYGIFEKEKKLSLNFPAEYFTRSISHPD